MLIFKLELRRGRFSVPGDAVKGVFARDGVDYFYLLFQRHGRMWTPTAGFCSLSYDLCGQILTR